MLGREKNTPREQEKASFEKQAERINKFRIFEFLNFFGKTNKNESSASRRWKRIFYALTSAAALSIASEALAEVPVPFAPPAAAKKSAEPLIPDLYQLQKSQERLELKEQQTMDRHTERELRDAAYEADFQRKRKELQETGTYTEANVDEQVAREMNEIQSNREKRKKTLPQTLPKNFEPQRNQGSLLESVKNALFVDLTKRDEQRKTPDFEMFPPRVEKELFDFIKGKEKLDSLSRWQLERFFGCYLGAQKIAWLEKGELKDHLTYETDGETYNLSLTTGTFKEIDPSLKEGRRMAVFEIIPDAEGKSGSAAPIMSVDFDAKKIIQHKKSMLPIPYWNYSVDKDNVSTVNVGIRATF